MYKRKRIELRYSCSIPFGACHCFANGQGFPQCNCRDLAPKERATAPLSADSAAREHEDMARRQNLIPMKRLNESRINTSPLSLQQRISLHLDNSVSNNTTLPAQCAALAYQRKRCRCAAALVHQLCSKRLKEDSSSSNTAAGRNNIRGICHAWKS